ncbi:MAG TPA: hypothetical protein VM328_07180 [Fimbriimonadaceae bacterium]|nr:hypothetical protein [Fimbriimonadaceae bacterium]
MKDLIKMVVLLTFAIFALTSSGCNPDAGTDPPAEVNSGIGSQNNPESALPAEERR